ncbi:MAG: Omp28-related outer membrane protein, partial [Tannerella sp.]|nr:Omp28-related outer membrane protein [Tannerella sp.]
MMKQIQTYGLRLLGTILLLPAIASGCASLEKPEPAVIELSVDKTVIKANGADKAVFTVTADGVDVTPTAVITRKDLSTEVADAAFSTREPDAYTFYAAYDGQLSGEITVEATEVILSLTADRTEIRANNKDRVSFTVMADDEDVTSMATVILAGEPETALDAPSFSTKTATPCTFYATYDGHASNEVTVDVTEVILAITADRAEMKANNRDAVSFTVMADDENVTALATVILAGEPETVLDAPAFSTKTAGTHTFYARYDGLTSAETAVEVLPVILSFTPDRLSFKADRMEQVFFTVMADDENVTASAVIVHTGETPDADTPLAEAAFATDDPGTHRFYAVYDGDTTETCRVEAEYEPIPFLRQYLIMQFTGTSCPNCPNMTAAIQSVLDEWASSRMIHVIRLHLNGKHCNSTLAGAIAETSNGLSSDYFFPSTLVDLREEVPLYATTTPRELKRALSNSGTAPAETGIAIESQLNGAYIDIKVKLRATRADRYQFYAFIVEDDIHRNQAVPAGGWESYIHDDVATYLISDANPREGIDMGFIEPGEEAVRNFSIETSLIDSKRTVNLSNCRIVGYTLKPVDEGYELD